MNHKKALKRAIGMSLAFGLLASPYAILSGHDAVLHICLGC